MWLNVEKKLLRRKGVAIASNYTSSLVQVMVASNTYSNTDIAAMSSEIDIINVYTEIEVLANNEKDTVLSFILDMLYRMIDPTALNSTSVEDAFVQFGDIYYYEGDEPELPEVEGELEEDELEDLEESVDPEEEEIPTFRPLTPVEPEVEKLPVVVEKETVILRLKFQVSKYHSQRKKS